jgi:hypothetical protein
MPAKIPQIQFAPFTGTEPEVGMGFNSQTSVFPGTTLSMTDVSDNKAAPG